MIVLVGGQTRKSGKTTVICEIISATPEAEWHAVKITPHHHEPGESANPDTHRFLSAGAVSAELLAAAESPDKTSRRNMIVESNSALDSLRPDLIVFVENPGSSEWKASAMPVFRAATFIVPGRATAELIAAVRARLSEPQ